MLLTGEIVLEAEIRTPGGPVFRAQILEQKIRYEDGQGPESARPVCASCAVRKDGGDDPDITTGTLIEAKVTWSEEPGITIDGGTGIGRVTKPGLDQPVGAAAINHVPRQMITASVEKVLEAWREEHVERIPDAQREENAERVPDARRKERADVPPGKSPDKLPGLRVIISAPEGEALAARTFNPKLGITGGISILGTTGIVEPMSDRAVVETIRAQMSVLKAEGARFVVMAPGNYGLTFLTQEYGLREDWVVLISNYAAEAVELAAEAGFEGILLAGHIGKLVKIAGGVRNTHSMYGDRRMEILGQIAGEYCTEQERNKMWRELEGCVMTDAALQVLEKHGLKEKTVQEMANRIRGYLEEWSGGKLRAEVVVFANKDRELVRTEGAEEILRGENL